MMVIAIVRYIQSIFEGGALAPFAPMDQPLVTSYVQDSYTSCVDNINYSQCLLSGP